MNSNIILKVRHIILYNSSLVNSLKSWKTNKMYAGARNLSIATNTVQEQKINVNGININYAKTGTGNHPVLLLPGALGAGFTDFKPQLENLNGTKLTLVAWDPPGYGKSRPPTREFPDNFFERDASYAHDLMKKLGYSEFSLMGWSDGGITALILAAKYQSSIRKLILLAANSYISQEDIKAYKRIMNIDTWSERMKAPLLAMYGDEYFRKTWGEWYNAMIRLSKINNGDLCKHMISNIKRPTLIIQGDRDLIVPAEHPFYLKKHIANSRLEIIEKGTHNLHFKYYERINKLMEDFLNE